MKGAGGSASWPGSSRPRRRRVLGVRTDAAQAVPRAGQGTSPPWTPLVRQLPTEDPEGVVTVGRLIVLAARRPDALLVLDTSLRVVGPFPRQVLRGTFR